MSSKLKDFFVVMTTTMPMWQESKICSQKILIVTSNALHDLQALLMSMHYILT